MLIEEIIPEVSKEEFDAIQNGYVDIEFDKKWWPLDDDYPLIKHVGNAIGATSWTSWGKVGVPWSEKEMIGGSGTYMLKGDFGHVLLDAAASYRPNKILMSQISTSERGTGVGSKVMNAIKQYVDQKNLPLTIYKVTNKEFFNKFPWLEQTAQDVWEYNPDVKESVNENVSALASELKQKYDLKDLWMSDMASRNAIELSSIIVNKKDQGAGTGSAVMNEIVAYAEQNGKILVLDPGLLDKQHGTTSQSRLRKFYKRFGFIDNKGRNKNYEFRNLMIRYPQGSTT